MTWFCSIVRRRPLSQIFTRDTQLRNLVSLTFMPCISDIFPSLVSYLLPLLFLLLRHSYYLLVPSVSLFPAFYSPNRHLFCLNRWQLPSISCTVKPRYTGPKSKQSGASDHVSGASERANGRASGPVLQSVFLAVYDHSALRYEKNDGIHTSIERKNRHFHI